MRAAELLDAGAKLESGFLDQPGRPARESACECERATGLMLGPVMALVNGPTIAEAISDPNNDITKLTASLTNDEQLVDELFMLWHYNGSLLALGAVCYLAAATIFCRRDLPAPL